MAHVRSLPLAGKSVNVPHSEHRVSADVEDKERNAVTFDSRGFATVSETLANSLVEFYPTQIERVASSGKTK